MNHLRPIGPARRVPSQAAIGALCLFIFLVRAICPGQPIVENYVGRQVPTAMVARNLDRGSGFFRPQLETAPFPNYFVVEPPLYQSLVVAFKRVAALGLAESGRIVSALMMAVAGLALYELARRREGTRIALMAVFFFSVFPLTLRYGRAFQPDASMLGATMAGVACWDRSLEFRSRVWLIAGWCLLAVGLAIKITSAFLLLPLLFLIARKGGRWQMILAVTTLVPGLLWYLWALQLIGQAAGSHASADNRAIWLGMLGISGLFKLATIKVVAWTLLVRAFTPLGAALAIGGLLLRGEAGNGDRRFWWVWGGSTIAAMALLAGKLHHEYYWLPLAPVVAVGAARALDRLLWKRVVLAGCVGVVFALMAMVQTRSTWQMPLEWAHLEAAGIAIKGVVPREDWLAASEALLFQADRRGCRMEWTGDAVARAAGEWGRPPGFRSPLELLEFYRGQGARYFADLGSHDPLSPRKGLHDGVRRRYKVIVDSPEVLIADLSDSGTSSNAN